MMPREERSAKAGKFRIIGVDTFDGDDWIESECDTLDEAKAHVTTHTDGKQMLKMHIYDDQGVWQAEGGSF